MSTFKRPQHKVKLQKVTDIPVVIPVIPTDTSVSNLSGQRRQSIEPNYTGDNQDFAYRSVTEQRHLLETVKNENQLLENTVKKQESNKKFLDEFNKSKVQPKIEE